MEPPGCLGEQRGPDAASLMLVAHVDGVDLAVAAARLVLQRAAHDEASEGTVTLRDEAYLLRRHGAKVLLAPRGPAIEVERIEHRVR